MVRFILWAWSNSLRVWKAALTKPKLSFSDESVNNGLDYLNKEVFKNI